MLRLLLAIAAAAVLWLPTQAGAAVALTPCGKTAGLLCGEVSVPLDRTGKTPGTSVWTCVSTAMGFGLTLGS